MKARMQVETKIKQYALHVGGSVQRGCVEVALNEAPLLKAIEDALSSDASSLFADDEETLSDVMACTDTVVEFELRGETFLLEVED